MEASESQASQREARRTGTFIVGVIALAALTTGGLLYLGTRPRAVEIDPAEAHRLYDRLQRRVRPGS